MFVISLKGLYYRDFTWEHYNRTHDSRCWTRDLTAATRWKNRETPEKIIEYWTMTEPKDENGKPIKGVPLVPRTTMLFSHATKKMEPSDGATVLGSMLTREAHVMEIE
jgi:hypothetical protein